MTTRPPTIGDRPQGEVFAGRPVPDRSAEDAGLEHGWVWDDVAGQIIGYEGVNPTGDTFVITFSVGLLKEEFVIPPGTRDRIRINLPPSRRLACRRATIADPLWQRRSGWVVPGVDSIHIERTYGRPVRNSPSVASVAVTEFFGGATTTHNVPMPATVDAGDLLLVMWFHDNASLTQASGFAPLGTATLTDRCYIFARVAVGNEDSANVNFQALTASFALAHTYRISAATWAGVLSGVMVTTATGNTATPNPPNNAPHLGSDDYLWLVFAGKTGSSGQSIDGAPTNYTNFTADSSDLSGSARRSTTAASEDPGTFSGTGTDNWMAFTIAIASDDIDLGDIPVFVGVGNTAQGTTGVTAALPGGIITGDKLLLHIQGEGEDTNADPANADWTLVETAASATGGAAGDTRLTVYEVDYNSASPPDLSIGDAGDHIICYITAWRDPNGGTIDVHVFQATTDSTADTSLSATGVTTTIDNALIVISVGLGDDSGVLAWVNANLAAPPITPAGSDRTTQGSDGSVDVAYGGLAAQGASGTTTGTLATSEEEANIVLALVPVGGGTVFQESMGGTVTPAAALIRETTSRKTGTVTPTGARSQRAENSASGSTGPTGSLSKRHPRTYSGSATPAGARSGRARKTIAGDLDVDGNVSTDPKIRRGGTITPAGSLSDKATKTFTGNVTPSGLLTRVIARVFAGTITLAGTLETALRRTISVAGSITPSGLLRRITETTKTGTTTPAGSLTRRAQLVYDADLDPTGSVLKMIETSTEGEVDPEGDLTRTAAALHTGVISPVGAVSRALSRALSGTITPAGELTLQQIADLIRITVTGTINLAGSLLRDISRTQTGQVGPTGHYGPTTTSKTTTGTVEPSGTVSLLRLARIALSGAINVAGQLTRRALLRSSGFATPAGSLLRDISRKLAGNIAPLGSLRRVVAKTIAGLLEPVGSLVTDLFQDLAGPVTFVIRNIGRTTTPVSGEEDTGLPHQGAPTATIPGSNRPTTGI